MSVNRYIISSLLSALVIVMVAACNKIENNFEKKPHNVLFEAQVPSVPETKPALMLKVVPDWRNTDVNNVHIYETETLFQDDVYYREASKVEMTTPVDGTWEKAYFYAEFDAATGFADSQPALSKAGPAFEYTAIIATRENEKFLIPSVQHPHVESLIDPNAYFMIGKCPSTYSSSRNNQRHNLDFHCPVALSRLSITNLEGSYIESVKITTVKNEGEYNGIITGEVDYAGVDFETSTVDFQANANSYELTMLYPNGLKRSATTYVYMVTVPGSKSVKSVEVVTDKYVYTKSFTSPASITYYSGEFVNIALDMTEKEGGNVTRVTREVKPVKPGVKLLLVGSSHGMNTIAQVPWICYNSTNQLDMEVGNVYLGSLSLQKIVGMNERSETCSLMYFKEGRWSSYSNKSFAEVFSFTDWDFICIQRSASDDELWLTTQSDADKEHNAITNINHATEDPAVYMSHSDAMRYVLDLIKNNATKEAEVIFSSGFADPSEGIDYTQTDAIISTAKKMKAQFGVDYVPIAIAVRNARNTFLRYLGGYSNELYPNHSNQLCYDSQHLDYGIGCYVAGVCLLEFICRKVGRNVVNLDGYGTYDDLHSFKSNLSNEQYTELTPETMMVAKSCAICACDTPDAVSDVIHGKYKWKVSYNLSNGITASNSKGYSADTDNYVTTFTGFVDSIIVKSRAWDRSQSQTTLVLGTDYTYDPVSQTLTILSVEGDIEIIVC